MHRLYNTALMPFRWIAEAWARLPAGTPERKRERSERLARDLPAVPHGAIWIHGASLGEARLVGVLAGSLREARPGLPLVVSAVTPAGRLGLPEPPSVDGSFFAPLDFPGTVRRAFDHVRPGLLVLVETELWPNLLRVAHDRGVPVVIANARLSTGRLARYRRFRSLYAPLLAPVAAVCARTDEDAHRFVELGVPASRVGTAGNIKYDLSAPTDEPRDVRASIGIDETTPLWIAGSTGENEEIPVLEAHGRLRPSRPTLRLIIAPRHVRRADEVEAAVRARGMRPVRHGSAARSDGTWDVLIVDGFGELNRLYRAASVAFVGGTLVPVGGHNLLEPAASAIPVLFGPHTDHVAEPAEALVASGGGRIVRDASELAACVGELLDDPARARETGARARDLVERNRGSLERTRELLLAALDRSGARSGAA